MCLVVNKEETFHNHNHPVICSIYIYWGVTGYNFQKIIFLSLKVDFVLANSAEPDEIHLGLHCLPRYPSRGYLSSKVFNVKPFLKFIWNPLFSDFIHMWTAPLRISWSCTSGDPKFGHIIEILCHMIIDILAQMCEKLSTLLHWIVSINICWG